MDNFIEKIKTNIKIMQSFKGFSIFTIATTSKQEIKHYITPIRKNKDFIVSGCVIFDQTVLLEITEIIDGKVDLVLIDTEKKIPLRVHDVENSSVHDIYAKTNTISPIETGNLSKICFNNIYKSKIYEYKPNDLTVDATWLFLSQKLNFLSGKKITILGAGNIGSKLALKLVECGATVNIHRNNLYKGHTVTNGLNIIKPQNTVSNIIYHEEKLQASFMSDVLIGASDGEPVITKNIIKSLKEKSLIIDLGKNNLTTSAIEYALEKKIELYRTDITAALEGFIYSLIKMNYLLENAYGKRDLGYCQIVGGGYFGQDGDIVVDKIDSPTQIYGIANGKGLFKDNLTMNDNEKISRLQKEIDNA